MRVFLSYRRDDTAGRAGRLHDALLARLGARNVFMDVAAIEVGTDFATQVEQAIAESDVSLVVIGPNWLRLEGADGGRRLDDPDDHVRSEVRAALDSTHPVVPVLVGGAALPSEEELPPDLAPLVRRQAVELHDEIWPQDVEMLIRRLEGKDVVRSRSRLLPVAIGLVVLGVVAAVAWPEAATDPNTDDEITGCPEPDESWALIDVPGEATTRQQLDDMGHLRYTVEAVYSRAEPPKWLVVLEVRLFNETEDEPNTNDDHTGIGSSLFDALYVNHVSADRPSCFSIRNEDDDLSPDEATFVLVGYQSLTNPDGVSLRLETDASEPIDITPGTQP